MTAGAAPTPRWVVPVTTLLLAIAGAALAVVLATTFIRVPLLANEGWSALHARHALAGANIYTPDGYAIFPNYPPLAFYPVAWLGLLIGDLVYSGRVLSILSLLLVTLNVGLLARNLGARPAVALLGAALYLVLTLTVARYYIGVSDPQFFGHALQSTGLVLLTRTPGVPHLRALLGAALLMLLGGLVKNNLVILPLAVAAWLALLDRKALLVWVLAGSAGTALAAGLCYLLFGEAVFAQVLGHERVYRLTLIPASLRWMAGYLPFAAIGIWAAWRIRAPAVRLVLVYLGFAIGIGLVFSGGAGVNLNNYFDVAIAALPLAMLAVPRLATLQPVWRTGILAIAAITPLYLVATSIAPYLGRAGSIGTAARYAPAIARISAADGPVFCQNPTWCYWAGKDNLIDYSNTGQKLAAGPAAIARFQAVIAAAPPVLMQVGSGDGGPIVRALGPLVDDYVEVMSEPLRLWVRQAP